MNPDQELQAMADEYDHLMREASFLCDAGHEVASEDAACPRCVLEAK